MKTAIRHIATGLLLCAEPPHVIHRRVEKHGKNVLEEVAIGGHWSAVVAWNDATVFPTRNAAVTAAKGFGMTSERWEPVSREAL